MIDPKRLSDGSKGARAAELLLVMRADAPNARAKAKALAAFGLGAGLAEASAEAATLAKAGLGAKSAGWLVPAAITKWAGIGALVGGLSLAGVSYVQHQTPNTGDLGGVPAGELSSVPIPTNQQFAAATIEMPATPASAPSLADSVPSTAASWKAASVSSASGSAGNSGAPFALADKSSEEGMARATSTDPGATLVQEVRVLDRVRAAMAGGDGALALRTLQEYRSAFPRRQLDTEALMLQIQGMTLTGDRAGAQALARSFITHNPRSPLVDRVRSVAGIARDEKVTRP